MRRALVAIAVLVAAEQAGCASVQSAAAKDPLRCERDPSCAKRKGRIPDCTQQCTDNWECIQRCEEVQQGIDAQGHP